MKAWPISMPRPETSHCLFCEDIRLERRNLTSFMGVFGVTPFVKIRVRDFKLGVNFCTVFMGAPSEGKFVLRPELRNPDGTQIEAKIFPESSEMAFTLQGGPILLGFRMNATFPGPNTYTIILFRDGVEFFKDTFQLDQATDADFA